MDNKNEVVGIASVTKVFTAFAVIITVLTINANVTASDTTMIYLRAISFDSSEGEPDLPAGLSISEYPVDVKGYYIVQFIGPVKPEWKEHLGRLGCEIYDYIPNNAFIVRMDAETKEQLKELEFLQWIGIYQPAYRISSELSKDLPGKINITVLLFRPNDREEISNCLVEMGGRVSASSNEVIRAEIETSRINDIANINGVEWIEEYIQPTLLNDVSRWVIQSYIAGETPVWEHNITGAGQIVGISDSGLDYDCCFFWDTVRGAPPEDSGLPSTVTPDYNQRKVIVYHDVAEFGDYDDNSGHGTHTSGSIAGDNLATIGSYDTNDGMAYNAKLVFQDIGQDNSRFVYPPADLNDLFQQAYDDGARLHSNSWGAALGGEYTTDSKQCDEFMWNHKDFLILFSNGNSGPDSNTVGSPATAKNVVSVGATENGADAENMARFSSHGPTDDGRTKPTVSAPGVGIKSADSDDNIASFNCGLVSMTGTSMSCPTTVGVAALIRQYFVDGYYLTGKATPSDSITPSAALIKAMLVNSGEEMTGSYTDGPIPSNGQGWGRILLDNALYFEGDSRGLEIHDSDNVITGQNKTYNIAIDSQSEPLEVTLVWTDYLSTPAAAINLVNNLNLVVVGPSGTYHGNVFSGGESVPGGTADNRNVVESVYIKTPPIGAYTITITGYNVPYGPQPFALVITGSLGIGSKGVVYLDKELYNCTSKVNVTLKDEDLNTDNTTIETATVNISSTTETTPEIIHMIETGENTAIFTGSIRLTTSAPITDGNLSVTHGDLIVVTYKDADDGTGNPTTAFDTAAVDCVAPSITITSPINNTTYNTTSVALNYTVNEKTDWISYSLDGQPNVTITGNTTLANLSVGWNTITVFASDIAGNVGASDKILFNITSPDIWIYPESFVIILPQGNITNRTLTIGNNGTALLVFEIRDIERRVYNGRATANTFTTDSVDDDTSDSSDHIPIDGKDTGYQTIDGVDITGIYLSSIPTQPGWPQTTGGDVASSPALGDIDGNGDLEVVVGSRDNKVYAWLFSKTNASIRKKSSRDNKVYAWHHDGSTVTGWPKTTGDDVLSSPALRDIDGDGDIEIVVGSYDNKVYAWHHDGTTLFGWPQTIGDSIRNVALGDLDGDGDMEIVAGSYDNKVYAWHHDGTTVPGWPITTGDDATDCPALGDLDGDGDVEIVAGSYDNKVYAWHHDGTTVSGFPITTGGDVDSSPSLGDIDGDGDIEIVIGSDDSEVYAWDCSGTYNPGNIEWETFHHDIGRRGLYGYVVEEGWLSEYPVSGKVDPNDKTNITLTINTTNLKVGKYNAIILIKSNDQDENTVEVPLQLIVTQPNPPSIWIYPESFDLTLQQREVVYENLTIGNNGTGVLEFNISYTSEQYEELFNDSFPSLTINTSNWFSITGSPVINTLGINAPSPPYSLELDGSGDTITSRVINLSGYNNAVLSFYYELGGGGEAPDSDDWSKVDYFSSNRTWNNLWFKNGDGENHNTFDFAAILLPSDAYHSKFQFRFKSSGSGEGYDDFYIDNIVIKRNVWLKSHFSDTFPTTTINMSNWVFISGNPVINTLGINEPSPPYSLDLDGAGDTITSRVIDLSGNRDAVLSFYYELGGSGEAPDSDDWLKVNYFSSNGSWINLWSKNGDGENHNAFNFASIPLPSDACHSKFQFKFKSSGSGEGYDDFYIENVRVGSISCMVNWINMTPMGGIVNPGKQRNISVTINTTTLDEGEYNAIIFIKHNDTLHESPLIIPLNLKIVSLPHIISFSPTNRTPTQYVGTTYTFNVTMDQVMTSNRWFVLPEAITTCENGTFSLAITTAWKCAGIYNVTYIGTNENGSVTITWIVTVLEPPTIVDWYNNRTKNNSTSITMNISEEIYFNVTANQSIDTWNWFKDRINQNNNYEKFSTCWSKEGEYTISVNASNVNGTSNTVIWTVNVRSSMNSDLIITDTWVCTDNCTICYNITNIGSGTAPPDHNTSLLEDGVGVTYDLVPVSLAHSKSYIGCFKDYNWTYTPPEGSITVCADCNNTVEERNETNNCLITVWMCGDINCDRTVDMSDVIDLLYSVGYPGQYTICNEWTADVNCDKSIDQSDVRALLYYVGYPGQYELNCRCSG